MSGGSLDYFYCQLEEHVGDFGDKELDALTADLAELFHDREWYLSGDTGKGEWTEARNAFKKKWFTTHGREERIEKYLAEVVNEVRESFGINQNYCEMCKHWKLNSKSERYGICDFEKCCMTHRSESCDKWECRE